MKVKILGLSCAYRNEPDAAWFVQYALKAVEKFGRRINERVSLETEFVDLADKEIKPCGDCPRLCAPSNAANRSDRSLPDSGCIIEDDYMMELLPKIKEADGFVFGSSVHNLTYSTKFALLADRLNAALFQGYLSRKPATALTCGNEQREGGQLSCIGEMGTVLVALEMLPIGWGASACGWGGGACLITGAPFVGRKDYMGIHMGVWAGRKVAEYAVMSRVARQKMGPLYTREFMQVFHRPDREEPWWWNQLDKEDEEYMMGLEKADIMKLGKK
jgi:multimeric flavodoxin WrbA